MSLTGEAGHFLSMGIRRSPGEAEEGASCAASNQCAALWSCSSHGTFFFFFNNFKFIYLLFIFGCVGSSFLCKGFPQLRQAGATLHRGVRASSQSRPLLLRSTGSRRAGSVVVAHRPSCSAACGIFPDQGLNPCPLHWQADSQPLRHQGSSSHGTLTPVSL